MKDTKKFADLLIGIALMVFSAFLFNNASHMPQPQGEGIGPGYYPMFLCGVLFVLSTVQVIMTIVKCKGIPLVDYSSINVRYIVRAFIMMLMTFVYYKLLKKVGFLLLTPIYLYGSFMLFGYKKKIKGAIIAVIFAVVVYFLFTKVFMVFLPRGILG